MDNKKIGKLIADLRKKQGLTQQELGDKVGVGFRAVSKWERGITVPDISIINELSKILGISSDELLTGKVNKENKPKEKKKVSINIKISITAILLIIFTISSIFIYNYNKVYEYNLTSLNEEEYYVQGKLILHKNNISILIDKIEFKDLAFASTKIKNYEYEILLDDKFIYGYGYNNTTDNMEFKKNIEEFSKNFNINYRGTTKINKKEITKQHVIILVRFFKENGQQTTKKIKLKILQNNSL